MDKINLINQTCFIVFLKIYNYKAIYGIMNNEFKSICILVKFIINSFKIKFYYKEA
jgi:hypothetical protein